MEMEQALDIGREAFEMSLIMALPVLAVGLLVGLVISLFQAVTQLHEQTLTFIPKIVAMVAAGAFFIPWIATRMLEYAEEMFGRSPW